MFKAEFKECKTFKDSISAISELITIGCLKLDDEGFTLSEMDDGHVCFIHYKLNVEEFNQFDLSQPLNFFINMEKLDSILDRVNPDDTVEMEYTGVENYISLKIIGNFSRTFFIYLLEEETVKITEPDLKFSSKMKIDSSLLKNVIYDTDKISGGFINFEIDDSSLIIRSKGEGGGLLAKIKEDDMMEFYKSEVLSNLYSSELLKKIIIKGSELSMTATIEMGVDLPIKIAFSNDNVKLVYVLVPLVEEI